MPDKRLVILGTGNFGREIQEQLNYKGTSLADYKLIGFVDQRLFEEGKKDNINGLPLLGGLDWLLKQTEKIFVLICFGSSEKRQEVVSVLKKNLNINFPNFISDTSRIAKNIKMGVGNIFCWSSVVSIGTEIGNFLLVNINSVVGHDVLINDFVTIHSSVNISGNCELQYGSELGVGAKIIPNKVVGRQSTVGAGAIVFHDVLDNCTVLGNPAKVIRMKMKK